MSTRTIGNTYERKTKELFEAQGWTVERALAKTVWIGGKRPISIAYDFFGVYDLLCIRHCSEKAEILGVQVKYHGPEIGGRQYIELEEIRVRMKELGIPAQIWVWKKNGRKVEPKIETVVS